MKRAFKHRLAAVLIALSAALPSPGVAQEAQGAQRDAQSYAQRYGVSPEEATRRLQLQITAGELNERLSTQERATFAGLYIEHRPAFRVVAKFTGNGEQALARHVAGGPLAGVVQAEQARVPLTALEAAQMAGLRRVQALGIRAEAGIDVRRNRAEVYVLDDAPVKAAAARGALQLPDDVDVRVVRALSENEVDIFAGHTLTTCTAGFSVRNAAGTRGITTAAHCQNAQAYSGTNLPFQAEWIGGSNDVQWHTAPGLTVRNLLWDGLSNRSITATWGRASQNVGDYVCKYGLTTGYTCGHISDKNYVRTTIANSTATWIRVSEPGVNLSEGGDSGGPWFLSNYAYGIHACGIGDDACYMAINYVSALGLTILIQ